jgi:hypothetical protein
MLDEFAALTGHHRKHAMRLLRAGILVERSSPRPERRVYDQAMRDALIVVWEASDRIWIMARIRVRSSHIDRAPPALARCLL